MVAIQKARKGFTRVDPCGSNDPSDWNGTVPGVVWDVIGCYFDGMDAECAAVRLGYHGEGYRIVPVFELD